MPRALKLAAVLILVVLLPLRAVAGVTIGFCASGHQDMAISAHGTGHAHDTGGHAHHDHESPAQPVKASCNICVEHCSSAAFATSAESAVETSPVVRDHTLFIARSAPAFFPDRLDRPPLA